MNSENAFDVNESTRSASTDALEMTGFSVLPKSSVQSSTARTRKQMRPFKVEKAEGFERTKRGMVSSKNSRIPLTCASKPTRY